jgi:parallel beta-helix repeat protein
VNTPYNVGAGIELYRASNVTVVDTVLSAGYTGLHMYSSSHNTFRNNTISGTTANNGIYIQIGSNNTIDRNRVMSSQFNAISMDATDDNTISNNTLFAPARLGIGTWDSERNVLSGNNFTSPGQHGIYAIRSEASFVSNNTVHDAAWSGVCLDASARSTLRGNDVTDAHSSGVYVYASGNCGVTNNTIGDPLGNGVYLSDSAGSTIANNTIDGPGSNGIYLYMSEDCDIDDNIVNKSQGVGIGLSTCSGNLDGNKLTNCSFGLWPNVYGEAVQAYNDNMIITSGNTINGDPVYFLKNVDGGNATVPLGFGEVILLNVTNLWVQGLDLAYGGISAIFSSNVTVTKNALTNSTNSILILSSDNCTVSRNDIASPLWEGIDVEYSDSVNVSGNIVTDAGGEGICVDESANTTIFDNKIYDAGGSGIDVGYSDGNLIKRNFIIRSGDEGIGLDEVTRAVVFSNFIDGSEENGIYIDWSSNNCTISSNWVINSGEDGVYVYDAVDNTIWGTPSAARRIMGSTFIPVRTTRSTATSCWTTTGPGPSTPKVPLRPTITARTIGTPPSSATTGATGSRRTPSTTVSSTLPTPSTGVPVRGTTGPWRRTSSSARHPRRTSPTSALSPCRGPLSTSSASNTSAGTTRPQTRRATARGPPSGRPMSRWSRERTTSP